MKLTDEQRRLVVSSSRFVGLEVAAAARVSGRWVDADARQAGFEGLCRAACTWDSTRSTWPSWARAQIRWAIAEHRRVWNGRGLTPERVQRGSAVLHATAERVRPDPVDHLIDRIDGQRAFAALPGSARDKQIVLERAGGATTAELAARHRISEARVSQITFAVLGRNGAAEAIRPRTRRSRSVPTLSQLDKPPTSTAANRPAPRPSHAGPGRVTADFSDHDTVEVPGSSPVTPTR